MTWTVVYHDAFIPEFNRLSQDVQDHILARSHMLESIGPALGRPTVDTLKGSKHSNMKEIIFYASDGAWRVAFAFDAERNAVLLVAGDKAGMSQDKFYKGLIQKADKRYEEHLAAIEKRRKK